MTTFERLKKIYRLAFKSYNAHLKHHGLIKIDKEEDKLLDAQDQLFDEFFNLVFLVFIYFLHSL